MEEENLYTWCFYFTLLYMLSKLRTFFTKINAITIIAQKKQAKKVSMQHLKVIECCIKASKDKLELGLTFFFSVIYWVSTLHLLCQRNYMTFFIIIQSRRINLFWRILFLNLGFYVIWFPSFYKSKTTR